MKEYKTFDDLEFKPHEAIFGGEHARIDFPNGYGASVVFGKRFYSNGIDTYEIACMKDGRLCYPENTSFENDVVGYQTEEQITELMKEIQDF